MTDKELVQAARDVATIGCVDCRKSNCLVYQEDPAHTAGLMTKLTLDGFGYRLVPELLSLLQSCCVLA